jgi:hypothetical protein
MFELHVAALMEVVMNIKEMQMGHHKSKGQKNHVLRLRTRFYKQALLTEDGRPSTGPTVHADRGRSALESSVDFRLTKSLLPIPACHNLQPPRGVDSMT